MEEIVNKCKKTIESYNISRPSPESIRNITIDIDNKKNIIGNYGQVYVKLPSSVVITLFDSTSQIIETTICSAITNSNMDLNPRTEIVNGVKSIIVQYPRPTKQSRISLIKTIRSKAEEYKMNIRNIRRDWNTLIKKVKLSEDNTKKVCILYDFI